jgi:RimJ/RimL family protein N-acetyltransferase
VPALRDVTEADLDVFYEQQLDPEATAMALFPARDREAFDAHWRRVLADDSMVKRTIVDEGAVAGNVGVWEQEGRLLVGYWLGREFWGRGLATSALAELVAELDERPLHAWVAANNVGSIRVLEKCGFVEVERRAGPLTIWRHSHTNVVPSRSEKLPTLDDVTRPSTRHLLSTQATHEGTLRKRPRAMPVPETSLGCFTWE